MEHILVVDSLRSEVSLQIYNGWRNPLLPNVSPDSCGPALADHLGPDQVSGPKAVQYAVFQCCSILNYPKGVEHVGWSRKGSMKSKAAELDFRGW